MACHPLMVARCSAWTRAALSAAVLALASSAFAGNTYFVSTTGSDATGDGTRANPWETVQKGVDNLFAGDTLYIRDGFYSLPASIDTKRSGTASNRITIAGYPGEKPVLDFEAAALGGNNGHVINVDLHDYVTVQNLKIQNSNGRGVSAYLADYLEVMDVYTDLTYDSGIAVRGEFETKEYARYSKIWGNKISRPNRDEAPGPSYNPRWPPHEGITMGRTEHFVVAYNEMWEGGKEGIDLKGPDRYGEVHHNYIHDMERVAYYVDAWSDKIHDIEVYNNVSARNPYGISVNSEDNRLVENVTVRNNLVYDFRRIGIAVNGSAGTSDVTVINNTVIGSTDGGDVYHGDHAFSATGVLSNILFRNNIGVSEWAVASAIDPGASFDYGLYYYESGNNGNVAATKDATYSWVFQTFVDPASGDFNLKAGTDPIDAGHAGVQYNDPDGSRNDIGAFYYVSSGNSNSGGSGMDAIPAGVLFQDDFDTLSNWDQAGSGHGWIEQRQVVDGDSQTQQVAAMNRAEASLSRTLNTRGFRNIAVSMNVFQTAVSYEGTDEAGDADVIKLQADYGDGNGFQDLLVDDSVWQGWLDLTGNDFNMAPIENPALWGNETPTDSVWVMLPELANNNPNLVLRILAMSSSEQELYYVNSITVLGETILGDADGDGDVDGDDFNAWGGNFPIASGATLAEGDFDGDGDVDGDDFNIWGGSFPSPAPAPGSSAAAVVPEPASFALIGLGAVALLRRRR